jgi:diguanylate cyclase (GGDEF)-like protein
MGDLLKVKTLFANIGKIISSALEVEQILEGIMEEVRIFFEPENWSLMRLDPNTNELFFVVAKGINEEQIKDIRLKPGEGIAGSVVQQGMPIFVPDTSEDSRFTDKVDRITGFKTRSVIAVPLIYRDTVYGVIELVNRSSGDIFSEDDYLILKTIADFSAIAYSNAALYEQALHMGATDPLTGLYNRYKLEEILDEWTTRETYRRSDDLNTQIALVMIDVDNFKAINDTHGHRTGDRVLRHLARTLRSTLRSEDHLFRIGGDEFLAIIPVPKQSSIKAVELRLIQNLEKMDNKSKIFGFPIIFSYGISIGPPSKIKALIRDADTSMYEQKRAKSSQESTQG